MKPSELLRKAKALIEKPENWMQGSYGNQTEEFEGDCFCSFGAVDHTAGYSSWAITHGIEPVEIRSRILAWQALNSLTDNNCFIVWQDTRGRQHSEVMAKFDQAISNLEARGE